MGDEDIPDLGEWSSDKAESGEIFAKHPGKVARVEPEASEFSDDEELGVRPLDDEDFDSRELSDFADDLNKLFPDSVTTTAASIAPDDHKDPFEIDANAPLRVEGITPTESEFPLSCHLCGSLLYARMSEIGSKIRCHDCHSMVDVVAPKKAPRPQTPAPPTPRDKGDDGDDDGYRLTPAAELPRLDTTVDLSLGIPDVEDDEVLARKRARKQAGLPAESGELTASPMEMGADEFGEDSDVEFGLAPPDEDLLKPIVSPPDSEPLPNEPRRKKTATPSNTRGTAKKVKPAGATARDRKAGKDRPVAVARETDSVEQRPITPDDYADLSNPFSGLGTWLAQALRVVVTWSGAIRVAIGTIGLGVGYLLAGTGMAQFTEDATSIAKYGGFALLVVSAIPVLLTLVFVGILGNSIIRDAVDQRAPGGEWPEFSLGEMLSQLVYVGTSFWLAAIPGLVMGQVMWAATDFALWMLFCTVASSVLFAPVFLASVVFNDSPLALMSSEALDSLWKLRNRWIRYWLAALVISLLLTAGVATIGLSAVVGFIVGALQIALMFILYWMIGDLVGYSVRFMENQSGK